MSLNEKQIGQFDDYLSADSSRLDKLAFEDRLKSDQLLKENFDNYSNSVEAIITLGVGEEMKSIIRKNKAQKKPSYLTGIAASVSLLLLSALLYQAYFSSPSNEELFESYFQPYSIGQNFRGSNQVDLGLLAYQNGDYQSVLKTIEHSAPKKLDDSSLLMLGNSYLLLNKPNESISLLGHINGKDSQILRQNAEWYMALAYLKQKNIPETTLRLKKISTGNHLFSLKAQDLLDELQ